MPNYDFHSLNSAEFEALCADLLSEENGIHFEGFKAGKDQGIDLRTSIDGKLLVVQCKHYAKAGFRALLKTLGDELSKAAKLAPSRYIVATSVELSPVDKDKIETRLTPYVRSTLDILGRDDLNLMLGRHGHIERRHPKLWMHSVELLESVLKFPVMARSDALLREIVNDSARYVRTAAHDDALERLKRLHVVLITGEPGVGKTTLARHLAMDYVGEGYGLREISHVEDVDEWLGNEDEKIVLYMDDFLGRNYLDALERREDSSIVRAISRVEASLNKRLILTSRSVILGRARRLSDLLDGRHIDKSEFEIVIAETSLIDKARVLHSHLWHSDLPIEHLLEIKRSRNYAKIVGHRNFTPRLVEFVFQARRVGDIAPVNYLAFVLERLSDPSLVWQYVYDRQLNEFNRLLLEVVTFHGRSMDEADAKFAYDRLLRSRGLRRDSPDAGYEECVRACAGSVVNRIVHDHTTTFVTLFNPSIGDYLVGKYARDDEKLLEIFSALSTAESISNLGSMGKALLKDGTYPVEWRRCLLRLLNLKLKSEETSLDYRGVICDLASRTIGESRQVQELVANGIDAHELHAVSARHMEGALRCIVVSIKAGLRPLETFNEIDIASIDFDWDFWCLLGENIESLSRHDDDGVLDVVTLRDAFWSPVVVYLEDQFQQLLSDSGCVDQIFGEDDQDYVIDKTRDFADELIESLHLHPPPKLRDSLVDQISSYDIISDNVTRESRRQGRRSEVIAAPSKKDDWASVDALFERRLPGE